MILHTEPDSSHEAQIRPTPLLLFRTREERAMRLWRFNWLACSSIIVSQSLLLEGVSCLCSFD